MYFDIAMSNRTAIVMQMESKLDFYTSIKLWLRSCAVHCVELTHTVPLLAYSSNKWDFNRRAQKMSKHSLFSLSIVC